MTLVFILILIVSSITVGDIIAVIYHVCNSLVVVMVVQTVVVVVVNLVVAVVIVGAVVVLQVQLK